MSWVRRNIRTGLPGLARPARAAQRVAHAVHEPAVGHLAAVAAAGLPLGGDRGDGVADGEDDLHVGASPTTPRPGGLLGVGEAEELHREDRGLAPRWVSISATMRSQRPSTAALRRGSSTREPQDVGRGPALVGPALAREEVAGVGERSLLADRRPWRYVVPVFMAPMWRYIRGLPAQADVPVPPVGQHARKASRAWRGPGVARWYRDPVQEPPILRGNHVSDATQTPASPPTARARVSESSSAR